jgi:hypothetical protein
LELGHILRGRLGLPEALDFPFNNLLTVKVPKDFLYFLNKNIIPGEYDYSSLAGTT